MSKKLEEALNGQMGYYVQGAELLEEGITDYQRYEVWQTKQFGKLFRLDGCFMTSELDEYYYHENLVHVPAMSLTKLKTALIIGGGDGGSAKQLLKYPSIEGITIVELDKKVIDISKKYLQKVHEGSLEDKKVKVVIGDGLQYMLKEQKKLVDLILLDLTDPIGPAEQLYEQAFFRNCKENLDKNGLLSLHIGSPIFQKERLQLTINNLKKVFKIVSVYFMYIPLYGSLWGMACASDNVDPTKINNDYVNKKIEDLKIKNLKFYNGEIHQSQFSLPNYIKETVNGVLG